MLIFKPIQYIMKDEASDFRLFICAIGDNWIVADSVDSSVVINKNFEEEYSPLPSNRTDDFKDRVYFNTLEDALSHGKDYFNMKGRNDHK